MHAGIASRRPALAAALLSATLLLGGCGRGPSAEVQPLVAAPRPVDAGAWHAYLAAAAAAERIADPVARCLAHPDLPGNRWPAGSAAARCRLLHDPLPTLAMVEADLLAKGGVARVERRYADALAAHYAEGSDHEALFTAFAAFGGDADSRRVAELWRDRAPDSAFAMMALGRHFRAAAGEARGERSRAQTTDREMATMRRLMRPAIASLRAALAAEPRLSPACTDLMTVARLLGDDTLHDEAANACLGVDPLARGVRFQWLMARDQRWGGTQADSDLAMAEIRKLVDLNPALGALLARGDGHRAVMSWRRGTPRERLLASFEAAARAGPDPLYIGYAGGAARAAGDLPKAQGYLSQALRFAPGDTRFRNERADVLRRRGDAGAALGDGRHLVAIGSADGSTHLNAAKSLAKLGRVDEAREAYRRAMDFPGSRRSARLRWCETWILGGANREQALPCTARLVNDYPDDAEALFMRAWVLHELGEPGAADMVARFHAAKDRGDRRQRQMASELARVGL